MRLENLAEGMRVPNYRRLCDLLEEPIKDGNSKNAQVREWERFFSYERQGNAFLITEIFETAKIASDGRMAYAQFIEPLLLHYLWEHGGSAEHTFQKWSVNLGMTSGRAYDEEEKAYWATPSRLKPHSPLFKPYLVNRVSYEIATKTKSVLMSAVSMLERKCLVASSVRTYIIDGMRHRLATPDEKSTIDAVKDRVRGQLGLTNMFAVEMNPGVRKKFYDMVNQTFRADYGWTSVYTLLYVAVTENTPLDRYENIDTEVAQNNLRKEIQTSIRAKLFNNTTSSAEKNEKAWEELGGSGDDENGEKIFFISEMDFNDMDFLLGELI